MHYCIVSVELDLSLGDYHDQEVIYGIYPDPHVDDLLQEMLSLGSGPYVLALKGLDSEPIVYSSPTNSSYNGITHFFHEGLSFLSHLSLFH